MSIRGVIRNLVARDGLQLLTPALESDPIERHMFLSRDIYEAVTGLGAGVDERMGRLRAHLEVYICGGVVTVAMEPYRAKDAYMARLKPDRDEVWEIRDRSEPSIRVFGSFAEKDTFVALTWQWRATLGAIVRRKVSDRSAPVHPHIWPRNWPRETRACKAAWRRKFPSYQPCSGSIPDEYLTNWHPIGDPQKWHA